MRARRAARPLQQRDTILVVVRCRPRGLRRLVAALSLVAVQGRRCRGIESTKTAASRNAAVTRAWATVAWIGLVTHLTTIAGCCSLLELLVIVTRDHSSVGSSLSVRRPDCDNNQSARRCRANGQRSSPYRQPTYHLSTRASTALHPNSGRLSGLVYVAPIHSAGPLTSNNRPTTTPSSLNFDAACLYHTFNLPPACSKTRQHCRPLIRVLPHAPASQAHL